VPVDDRELLWLAYPLGYLGYPGVLTLAGWRCVGAHPEEGTTWLRPLPLPFVPGSGLSWPLAVLVGGPPHERRAALRAGGDLETPVYAAADLGDLLPCVDRRDPCTWAAALHDLAVARLAVASPGERPFVPGGTEDDWWVSGWRAAIPGWVLELSWGVTGCAQASLLFSHVSDTLEPERALVEARGRLRAEVRE